MSARSSKGMLDNVKSYLKNAVKTPGLTGGTSGSNSGRRGQGDLSISHSFHDKETSE